MKSLGIVTIGDTRIEAFDSNEWLVTYQDQPCPMIARQYQRVFGDTLKANPNGVMQLVAIQSGGVFAPAGDDE